MAEETKNPGEEFFEVEELDDKSLEDVAGGSMGTNSGCENGSCAGSDNTNCSNTTCFTEQV